MTLALVGLTKHIAPINKTFQAISTSSSTANKHVWDLLSLSYRAWWQYLWWHRQRSPRNVVCSSTAVLL